ncbi:MAG: hypothetical protein D3914_16650, partial [Candidatus Electrothrix sp. LOE2]|nr:hypothetical protein [Candidatus Electrothrix sp. LOE2]
MPLLFAAESRKHEKILQFETHPLLRMAVYCSYLQEKMRKNMKETLSVGMIGGGQMGEALMRGMIESGVTEAGNITVAEPMVRRREYLEKTYQVNAVETPAEVTEKSRVIILAIKPQIMEPVLRQYSAHLTDDHLLISIAAGIPLSCIEQVVGGNMRIIRVM